MDKDDVVHVKSDVEDDIEIKGQTVGSADVLNVRKNKLVGRPS